MLLRHKQQTSGRKLIIEDQASRHGTTTEETYLPIQIFLFPFITQIVIDTYERQYSSAYFVSYRTRFVGNQ